MTINQLMGEVRSLTQHTLTPAHWQALTELVSTIDEPQHRREVAYYLKDTLLSNPTPHAPDPWGLWCATSYTLTDLHFGDGWWDYCVMEPEDATVSLVKSASDGGDHFVDDVGSFFQIAERLTWHTTRPNTFEYLEIRPDASYKTHTLSWPVLNMKIDEARSWGDEFDFCDPKPIKISQNPFSLSDAHHPFLQTTPLPYVALDRMKLATPPGYLRPLEFGRKFTKKAKDVGRDLWPIDHQNIIAHKMGDFHLDTINSELQHPNPFTDVLPLAYIDHIVDVLHYQKQEGAPLKRALYFGDFTFVDGEGTPGIHVYTVTYERVSTWMS